ncbi:MAG: N-acetylmuramoyl-L-alanine amidase [Patescibacteria group bacterium]|jgi:N-acetylmuramoyl-L-alanine amidase
MKKLLLPIITLFVFSFFPGVVFAEVSPLLGKTIVIDAGHGGADPGTTMCTYIDEDDANLDIAFRLKALLEGTQAGANVVMTRTDDYDMSNEDRYTIANNSDGHVLVSIHLNGSVDQEKNGTMGLYAKIKKDKAFTTTLHNRLVTSLAPIPNLGITNFMSGVTLKSEMPATIQEAVFLSNHDECAAIGNGNGSRQQQIAQALFDGLEDWFNAQVIWTPPKRVK